MRKVLWLGGALLLSACGASDSVFIGKAGTAPAPQTFTVQQLTEGAITVTVPAGEWRSLRVVDTSAVSLHVASVPEAGAQPWFGIGSGHPESDSGRVTFMAVPEDRPWATRVSGFYRGFSPDNENALILGSNKAATTFSIGYDEQPFEDLALADFLLFGVGDINLLYNEEQAVRIAARPTVPARFESGRGGFAGSVQIYRLPNDQILKYVSGPIEFTETSILSAPGGAELAREYRIAGEQPQPGIGAASYQTLSLQQSGVADYEAQYGFSPYSRVYRGGGAVIGGAVPAYYVGLSQADDEVESETGQDPDFFDVGAGGPMFNNYTTRTEAGVAVLNTRYRFSGREGEQLAPVPLGPDQFVRAFYPDLFWLSWGYVNADFAALYGWTISENQGL